MSKPDLWSVVSVDEALGFDAFKAILVSARLPDVEATAERLWADMGACGSEDTVGKAAFERVLSSVRVGDVVPRRQQRQQQQQLAATKKAEQPPQPPVAPATPPPLPTLSPRPPQRCISPPRPSQSPRPSTPSPTPWRPCSPAASDATANTSLPADFDAATGAAATPAPPQPPSQALPLPLPLPESQSATSQSSQRPPRPASPMAQGARLRAGIPLAYPEGAGRSLSPAVRQRTAPASRPRSPSVAGAGGGGGGEAAAASPQAEQLFRVLTGLEDEGALFLLLDAIDGRPAWDAVRRCFRRAFPHFCGGDAVAAMRARLSGASLARCAEVLARRGIALDSGSPCRAAAVGVSPRRAGEGGAPEAVAAALFHCLTEGVAAGGGAQPFLEVLGRLGCAEAWDAVRAAFRTAYPSFHGGCLLEAMRAQLDADGVHAAAGVLGQLAPAGATPSRRGRGGSVGGGGGNTFTPLQRKTQAKAVYRALTGEAGGAAAVADVLESLRTPQDWCALQQQFRAEYGEFCGGELLRAMRAKMPAAAVARCGDVLRDRLGVDINRSGESPLRRALSFSPTRRGVNHEQVADALYRALTGQDKSGSLFRALEPLRSQQDWDGVRQAFRAGFPQFHGGDLVRAMRGKLSTRDAQRCADALAGRGVQLDGGRKLGRSSSQRGMSQRRSPSRPLSPARVPRAHSPQREPASSSSRPSRHAKDIFLALNSKSGTARVAEVLGQLKGPGEWEELKLQFQSAYPELGGGDLSKAVRERLTDNEIGKCSAALAGKGVTLDSVSSSSRASQQGKQLYRALTGQDSSSRVAEVLGQLKSPGEWEELKLQFQSAYPELGGGDLSKAVRERLTDNEIGKCSAALAGKGVTLDSVSSSSRASQQGKQLYRALTGQDSSSRVAEVLGQLKSPGEWEELKLQFQSAYPELGGGDLSKAVRERLTDNEIGKCSAALAGKGVTLDSVSSSSRASQQGKQLYRALTGQDSSSRVAEVLGQLKSPGEWEELKLQFQSAYPELGGGDLSKAVRERLTDNEIGKCSAAVFRCTCGQGCHTRQRLVQQSRVAARQAVVPCSDWAGQQQPRC